MMMMIRVPRTFSKIVCFFAMGQLVAHRYLMSSRWWETEGHRARIAPVAGSEGGLGAPRSREAGRQMRHDITNTAAEEAPGSPAGRPALYCAPHDGTGRPASALWEAMAARATRRLSGQSSESADGKGGQIRPDWNSALKQTRTIAAGAAR